MSAMFLNSTERLGYVYQTLTLYNSFVTLPASARDDLGHSGHIGYGFQSEGTELILLCQRDICMLADKPYD